MRVSVLTALALAACSAASPVGNIHEARGEIAARHDCECESEHHGSTPEKPGKPSTPETPVVTVPEVPAKTSTVIIPSVPTTPVSVTPVTPEEPEEPTIPVPAVPSSPAADPVPVPVKPTTPAVTTPKPTPAPGHSSPEQPADDDNDDSEGGCDENGCHGTGHLIQDLGPQADKILTVVGLHSKELLVRLSSPVAKLLSGLGLGGLGQSVGSVIKEASSIGDLIADLGEPVDCLLTVVGQDGGYLLIKLDSPVAALVAGLGLPSISEPVGSILGQVGKSLKRDEGLLEDLAPVVGCTLEIVGDDSKILLVRLSDPVAKLFAGLGLKTLAGPVGEVIKSAGTVGELIHDLGPVVDCLLTVVGEDGSILLVRIAPSIAGLVKGLGLPALSEPVGDVVRTLGENF